MRAPTRSYYVIVFCVAATLAASAMSQTSPGGRGGAASGRGGAGPAAPPAASTNSGRSGRLSDPRPMFEQVEARIKKIDEAELSRPAKRDYEVETGPTQKTKLFRADPKLFERKFMAKLIVMPLHEHELNLRGIDPRTRAEFPIEMRQLVQIYRHGHKPLNVFFEMLTSRCPEGHRPDKLTAFLNSPECNQDVLFTSQFGSDAWQFFVYATTAEEAEARTAAILRLFDCGAARPLQRYFLAEAQKHLTQARQGCDEFAKLSDEITAEEEKIAKPSEVSPDILSQLKAQRVMVAVELAGLNARVKACDSMLNEPKRLEVSTLQSISDMKVKAEIERIGTKEKLDQINAFIAEGDRRDAIQQNVDRLNTRRTNVVRQASNAAIEADTCAALVEYYAPRELEGNKIVVNPIEWTE